MALKKEYGNKVKFITVNIEDPDAKNLLELFPIRFIPTFYYIDREGNVIGEDVGMKSFEELEKNIKKLINQ